MSDTLDQDDYPKLVGTYVDRENHECDKKWGSTQACEICEPPPSMRNRERNSTTLKMCGWCPYLKGGHGRYNYTVEGSCLLVARSKRTLYWDTRCIIKDASLHELEVLQTEHRNGISVMEKQIEDSTDYIGVLKSLEWKAEYRPHLPEDRPYDFFYDNEQIMVFYEGLWYPGRVRIGPYHQSGVVNFVLEGAGPSDEEVSDPNFPIKYLSRGVATPTVMHLDDWRFFCSNPDVYDRWCNRAYYSWRNDETVTIPPINEESAFSEVEV